MRVQAAEMALALCGLTLVQCNNSPRQQAAAAPSSAPSSAAASSAPPLAGGYRVDALLALNPPAIKEIGAPRVSMEEATRKSMEGGAYVYSRLLMRFERDKLTMRNDIVFRFQKGFQWGWCEGAGSAIWNGKQLSLPGGVATKGDTGFVSAADSHYGGCNANIAPGTYTLTQEGGETRLNGSKDDALFAFVLVKDDTDPDVETRARTLAGNPKK